jgi:hypothetical protein
MRINERRAVEKLSHGCQVRLLVVNGLPCRCCKGHQSRIQRHSVGASHSHFAQFAFLLISAQEYNGWLYKTAHDREINGREVVLDGQNEKMAPVGWDLCIYDADVITICKLFPWSSSALVLFDGSTCLTCIAYIAEAGRPGG